MSLIVDIFIRHLRIVGVDNTSLLIQEPYQVFGLKKNFTQLCEVFLLLLMVTYESSTLSWTISM